MSIRGETNWARNLRAAGRGVLLEHHQLTPICATEVEGDERGAVVDAFILSSPLAAVRRIMKEVLPGAEHHPVFRIEGVESGSSG